MTLRCRTHPAPAPPQRQVERRPPRQRAPRPQPPRPTGPRPPRLDLNYLGSFGPEGVPDNHQLYTHAQATIALCELYGMTKDPQYRDAAQRAINFCVFAQAEEGGKNQH